MEQMTILKLSEQVRTEGEAYLFMEKMRWGDKPVCPHCGSEHVNYIKPVNGVSRTTRTGSVSERRVWKCQACPGRKQFSVLTGTIFHGTKIPVRTWLFVVFEMCASKNGVAAREIERKYGLSPKSAWFMLHRIREAMKREPLAGLLGGNGGVVVADETFIGGKRKNKHKSKLPEGEKFVPGDGRMPALNDVPDEDDQEHDDEGDLGNGGGEVSLPGKPTILVEVFKMLPGEGEPFEPGARRDWQRLLTATLDMLYQDSKGPDGGSER